MKISGNVLTCINEKDIKLGVLTIPEGVEEVASDFLRQLKVKPKKIIFPSSLKKLNNATFKNNKDLREVVFNGSIEGLPKDIFCDCSNLRSVKLPEKIKFIGDNAFRNCYNLRKINFPKSAYRIGQYSFAGCSGLMWDINLGNVEYIDDSAFEDCENIRKIKIDSEEMESIEERAFCKCYSLTNITLPKRIKTIKSGVFAACANLRSIVLPDGLEKISADTFNSCYTLKSVKLPDSIKLIASNAFYKCERLKNINMPAELLAIYALAFRDCKSLESIKFPSKLKSIANNAFAGCSALRDVEFNDSLQAIGTSAFEKCYLLKDVHLNEVDLAEKAFSECYSLTDFSINGGQIASDILTSCSNLKSLKIGRDVEFKNLDIASLHKLKYIYKDSDQTCFVEDAGSETDVINMDETNGANIEFFIKFWEEKDKLRVDFKNENVTRLYNVIYSELGEEGFKKFFENKNLKFFKQLSNLPDYEHDFNAFCKFYYNLGGFTTPVTETRITKSKQEVTSTINYAQMIGEFFKEQLAEEENLYQSSFKLFEGMKLGEFKPEFTKFFLNKTVYPQLVEELKRDNLFIKKCYEEFDEIQITNTSNKGYQRQLKPTVKKFVNAFIDNTYIGVTDENFDIASTLVPYFDKQETFEKALAIKEEKERLGTGNNILDEHLEEQDVFGDIDALARMIKSKGVSTLRIMSDIAKDNFTFEWLEKNDPKSYILGKLCHCCAFIEGKGFTYMKASIVNPDIQNLVIKDKNGVIVAKSTLYINRDQGYGIFNNLEINRDIHIDNLNEVFRKFQLGAVAFVDKYNKKHPDKPLRKINIGMENNKAKEQIEAEFEKEKDLLPSFKYSNYADGENNGDAASLKIQYTVWKEKDE